MTMYKCPRCGHTTHQKNDLRKHFLRKNKCSMIYANMPISECFTMVLHEQFNEVTQGNTNVVKKVTKSNTKYENDTILGNTKVTQGNTKVTQKLDFFENLKNKKNFFKCKKCEKQFLKKNSYYRHMKHYCKNLQCVLDINELYEEKLAQTKIIDELKKENEVLLKSKNMTIQNNSITNNNITINAFGKENLNYISKEYIHGLIREGPYGSIRKLIKYIHFNPDHKENHNIKIPNKRDKYAMVYDGSMWQVKNKKNMITTIADHAYGVIAEHCEDITSKKFDRFRDDFESEESRYMKKLAEDTELIILNGQKEIGLL